MKPRRAGLATLAGTTSAACLWALCDPAWAEAVSRPALRLLSRASEAAPFSLFEWGALALAALALIAALRAARRRGLRAGLARLGRALCALLLAALLSLCALWLPLYRCAPALAASASDAQLVALCDGLIASLNASELDFSRLPDDLPAKPAAFSFWMDALGLAGFYAFPTGEALYSPALPAACVPFVAVHERMHGLGVAGEGEANLAAWEACMARGGAYADSARLWALKYAMGLLGERDPAARRGRMAQMCPRTRTVYLESGGGGLPLRPRGAARALLRALGALEAASNYEILALRLASELPV